MGHSRLLWRSGYPPQLCFPGRSHRPRVESLLVALAYVLSESVAAPLSAHGDFFPHRRARRRPGPNLVFQRPGGRRNGRQRRSLRSPYRDRTGDLFFLRGRSSSSATGARTASRHSLRPEAVADDPSTRRLIWHSGRRWESLLLSGCPRWAPGRCCGAIVPISSHYDRAGDVVAQRARRA